jgi:carbonic anhydrase
MVVQIVCENSTAPVNIDKSKVVGPCLLKCDYNHDYGMYTPNITNNDSYLSLNYSGKTNPVKYNDLKYNVQEIRIYHPSLHKYGGVNVDGEIMIIHGGSGKNLIVSIPIMVGGKTDKGSVQLASILKEAIERTPTNGSSVTGSIGDFSLDKFIPNRKGYFSYSGTLPYEPCNGTYEYIVYSSDNALNITQKLMNDLRKIVKMTSVQVKSANLFFNKNGANMSKKTDDIYIDCQPVGEDGQILVNENMNGVTTTSDMDMDMEKIETFLYIIGGIVLAGGISYGINYLFKKFKKSD